MFYKNEGTLYLACNDKKAFSLLQTIEDILYIRLGNKLYRQIDGIPMGTIVLLL